MLQIASYPYSNVNYGSNISSVKKISSVTSKAVPNTKKAIGLGTILTSLFGLKKVSEAVKFEVKKEPKNLEYREEKVYDENGRLVNILKYSKADDVLSINVSYNPITGNVKQKDWMRKDGITEQYTEKYDIKGNKKTSYWYYDNSNKIRWMEEYGKNTVLPKEVTYFNKNGKVSEQIYLNDTTGNINDRFKFDENGNLSEHSEVAELTGKTTRTTFYYPNGNKTVKEFDILSGVPKRKFEYDKTGKLVDFDIKSDNFQEVDYYLNSHINDKIYDDVENNNTLSERDMKNISKFLIDRYNLEHSE